MSDQSPSDQLELCLAAVSRRPSLSLLPRVRVELIRDPEPADRVVLTSSAGVYALLRDDVARWDRERFLTLMLDTKHALIAVEEVSVGSLSSAVVHPREVFKAILLTNAAAFMVAHNHPSGDPTPSREDIEITRRLKDGAAILGLRFLDHVVIGRERYISFVDSGYW